jgi:hypothetical protein
LKHLLALSLGLLVSVQPWAEAQTKIPADVPVPLLAMYPWGLEPAAFYDRVKNRFLAPPQTPEAIDGALSYFLQPDAEITGYIHGEARSRFRLKRHETTRCRSFGQIHGTWAYPASPLKNPQIGFSSAFPGPREYIGTYPTQAFNAPARQLTLKLYERMGVAKNELPRVQTKTLTPLSMLNGTSVLLAVQSELPSPPGAHNACPNATAFQLIEKVGRRFVVRAEKFMPLKQEACRNYQLISSFGTDKTIDQLLLRGSDLQHHWYEVYKRNAKGAYVQVYKGGGC